MLTFYHLKVISKVKSSQLILGHNQHVTPIKILGLDIHSNKKNCFENNCYLQFDHKSIIILLTNQNQTEYCKKMKRQCQHFL